MYKKLTRHHNTALSPETRCSAGLYQQLQTRGFQTPPRQTDTWAMASVAELSSLENERPAEEYAWFKMNYKSHLFFIFMDSIFPKDICLIWDFSAPKTTSYKYKVIQLNEKCTQD